MSCPNNSSPDREEVLLQWSHRIRMIFNPVLWGNFFAGFGIPAVLLGIGFSFTGNLKAALLFPTILLAFFAVLWILIGIVMDIAGGFFASFTITTRGIYFSSGKREKNIANAATLIGAAAGSLSTTGAGLLAKSEQEAFIDWRNIKKVRVRKDLCYIFIREAFGTKPIGLYCNAVNFPQVLALVESKSER